VLKGEAMPLAAMLSVRNGAQALDFYQQAFGAEVLFRIDGDGGAVIAQLSICGSDLWVSDESPEHFNFSPASLGGATTRMILTVDNPDAVFARAISAGANSISPVQDQPYGWRVGRVLDPFGHHWEIGKPI
jgi:PhnB protein